MGFHHNFHSKSEWMLEGGHQALNNKLARVHMIVKQDNLVHPFQRDVHEFFDLWRGNRDGHVF
jgi:hypothetical protein